MTEYKVTLAGALPKGEGNGFDQYALAEALFRSRAENRAEQPRVALIVYGIRNADHGKDGINTTKIETLIAEPVGTEAGRRLVEQLLTDEYAARTGQAMMPYELAALLKATFADLPRTAAEIDETEAREQDLMSPTDELRKHLERVHGVEKAHLLTAEEADSRHQADHEGLQLGPLAHEEDWIGWTRADLEAAEFEADDRPADTEDRAVAALGSARGDVQEWSVADPPDDDAGHGDAVVTPLLKTEDGPF
jgi:hypothetical protein